MKIIYIVLISLFFTSCQELLFNDAEITRDISLEQFHAVKISGIYDIVFIQDGTHRLVISGKNNVNAFSAEVINDTLFLDDNKGITLNTGRNRIELHLTDLYYIVTYDPVNFSTIGSIRTTDLLFEAIGEISEGKMTVECNNLIVVNSANTLGYMIFNGSSENCTFFIRYGGAVFADSLFCRNAEVTTESVGDVFVNASETLDVSLLGPGNVYYYGNPVVTITEKRGNGNAIRKK